jgi:hypothetical protein
MRRFTGNRIRDGREAANPDKDRRGPVKQAAALPVRRRSDHGRWN